MNTDYLLLKIDYCFPMNQHLETYLHQKLAELDAKKDMEEITSKGKISFGLSSEDYGHLPSWNNLVKKSNSF